MTRTVVSQAFVGSNVLLRTPARMRVALSATASIFSVVAPLLIKETGFLLSEYRQASERQEVAHAEVSLEHDAALPVGSQAAPPSARDLNVDGFPWVSGEPVCDMLGRAVSVTGDEAFPGAMVVYSRGDGS